MRDRRPLLGKSQDQVAMHMPRESPNEVKRREELRAKRDTRKGMLYYALFLLIFLGIPLYVIARLTPFFVMENLHCRMKSTLWTDRTVAAMEAGYTDYFHSPPLLYSERYNRTMLWGTYDPSRIFAMKTRTAKPVMVGVAWYDTAGHYALRHQMPFVHNKVNSPRNLYKRNRSAEVMQVRWVVHDGVHYGKQTVQDRANRASVDIEFLKSPSGDTWHVRIHAQIEPTSPLEMVLYVANADEAIPVDVVLPDDANQGDWSPVLQSRFVNQDEKEEGFTLRVYDDHNPLYDTAPWRVYGLNTNVESAFSLLEEDIVGGTPAERAALEGKGIATPEKVAQLRQQRLDLRQLPSEAFVYIDRAEAESFRRPKPSAAPHNIIVLKKTYESDFRLELSMSHASPQPSVEGSGSSVNYDQRFDPLSTCQMTSLFRLREKRIRDHVKKIFKPLTGHLHANTDLYQRRCISTLGEVFGSLYYGEGHYLVVNESVDISWDREAAAIPSVLEEHVKPAPHRAGTTALVGSRTDEAFGQQYWTGLSLLFMVRWNKEMVKGILASWLVGTQDPETGFVPSRTGFTPAIRSITPRPLRYEHPTFGTPPTLLLGLQELLNEIERKSSRLARANTRKARNTPVYYKREREADREFLQLLLPSLRMWRQWWHRTQCGGVTLKQAGACATDRRPLEQWPTMPTGDPDDLLVYRWRSRDGHRIASSGMEDYPRPVCPNEHVLEAHVDLFSWIALLSQLISRIEVVHLGLLESVSVNWAAYLDALHWDPHQRRHADRVGCANRAFSPYTGYANLFPLMLGLIRHDVDKVGQALDLARNHLYTKYGLMSVSFDSVKQAREHHLPHLNLWMGQVWPSINLMFVYALKTIYMPSLGGPDGVALGGSTAKTLHRDLQVAMVETMRTGSRWWEYYNPVDGSGEGSKTYIASHALSLGFLADFA